MTLQTQLTDELKRLAGVSGASQTVQLTGPDGVELAIDFVAVDSMSCSFQELRLTVPALAGADIGTLKAWGERFCARITYLLEHIGPLEVNPDAGHVLIRSIPPDRQAGTTKFYEIMLQAHSGGRFSLRRYRSEKGTPGREQVETQATHEVLHKLVHDLVDTVPKR